MKRIFYCSLAFMLLFSLTACNHELVTRYQLESRSYHKQQLINQLSAKDLRHINDDDLCSAYSSQSPARLRKEIERRKLVTTTDWLNIRHKRIKMGMSQCAVLMACPVDHVCQVIPKKTVIDTQGKTHHYADIQCRQMTVLTDEHHVARILHSAYF